MSLRRSKLPKVVPIVSLLVLLVLGPIVFSLLQNAKGVEAAWVDDSFSYRNSIAITSHTAAENNVYVSVTLDTSASGQFQSDCGDLRFTTVSGDILPYYLVSGCVSASTVVHVFFKSMPAGAQTLYYYYGNPSAQNGFQLSDFSTQASSYAVGSIGSQEKGGAPIAYWKFDDGTGTNAQDSSPNNNDGTITGATWQTEDQCVSGKCLKFNGTSDTISLGAAKFDSQTDATVELWFYYTGTFDANRILFSRKKDGNNRMPIFISYSGGYGNKIAFENWVSASGVVITSDSTINANAWYHLSVTCGTGGMKMYINGKQQTSTNATTNCFSSIAATTENNIGSQVAGNYFNGKIDDVKIYNYARTAAQIKADFKSRGSVKGISVGAGSSRQNSDALSNGLVGYWKTDEATWSGTASEVIDSSGNGNHGTAQGTVGGKAYPTGGKFGNAGFFDGVDDYATITTQALTTYTFSAWVKPSSLTVGAAVFGSSSGGGFFMQIGGSNHWQFKNAFASATATVGQWDHLVGVQDSTTQYLYVNGVLINSAAATSTLTTTMELGRRNDPLYFNGLIDEVRIYNRALSPREVRDLYNWAPGPVGYWNMDEKSGSSANDISGNGNTGTITGALWTNGKYGSGLIYDGTNKYLNIPDPSSGILDPLYAYSISTWVKFTSTTNYGFIVSKSNGGSGGYELFRNTGSGQIRFSSCDSGGVCTGGYFDIQTTTQYNDGNWHHIGATAATNSTAKIYIDGILVKESSTITQNNINTTDPLTIGSRGNHGSSVRFNGSIDDVKIYNYARTQKQIVEDMNGGHPAGGSPVGSQVGYWKFDEGYGTVANDQIPGGPNGTITNATWNNNGKFGKSLTFDGNGDMVTVADAIVDTSLAHSYSFWFNASSVQNNKAIIGDWTGNNLGTMVYIQTNTTICAYITTVQKYCGTMPAVGTWHYGALVYDATNIYLYLDGKLQGSAAASTADSGNISIGEYNNTANTSFDGLIDEVKIYNYALTSDEVALDYNRGQAMVLGSTSDTSGISGGSVASTSASAIYCVPGDTATCTDPISEYNFEERTGQTVYDTGSAGNNATLGSSTSVETIDPTWSSGKIGSALNFDGVDDYAKVASPVSLPSGSNSFTTEMWIKSTNTTSNLYLLKWGVSTANNMNAIIYQGATNSFSQAFYANDLNSGANTVTNGAWNHLVATFDGTTRRLYVNGVQKNSDTPSSVNVTAGQSLWVGAHSNPSNYFPGKIDGLKIYDYARTPAQVAWDYNRGLPVGHWRLDECQGSSVFDSSGNGNTGTITIGASGTQTAVGTCTTSGTAWYNGVTGKFNSSLNFDGTDDYVNVGDPASGIFDFGENDFSVSFWAKTSTTGKTLISKGAGYSSSPNTPGFEFIIYDNYLKFAVDDTTAGMCSQAGPAYASIADGNWHHITGTRTSEIIKLYVDGVSFGTTDCSAQGTISNSNSLIIGARESASLPHNGQIDDVRIYNYALTAVQVKNLYNNGAVNFGPATGSP